MYFMELVGKVFSKADQCCGKLCKAGWGGSKLLFFCSFILSDFLLRTWQSMWWNMRYPTEPASLGCRRIKAACH